MSDLLQDFLNEADELLEALFRDIAELRERYSEGRARRALVAGIFRHVHTIKGTASVAELSEVSSLAHEMETLLEAVREGKLAVDREIVDLLDDSTNALSNLIIPSGSSTISADLREILTRLRRIANEDRSKSTSEVDEESVLATLSPEIASALSQHERQRILEAVAEGGCLYMVSVDFDLDVFDESFRELSRRLSEQGEVISTLPGVEASSPDKINFRILYSTVEPADVVAARIEDFPSLTLETITHPARSEDPAEVPSEPEEFIDLGYEADRLRSSTVRVDLKELDDMITLAHELMTDCLGTLDLGLSTELLRRDRTELEIRGARIRRRFLQLEENFVNLRMTSLGQTLTRLVRGGELAARTLAKPVAFTVSGHDVRMDKSIADAVLDPLLHIVRNAVSHGIEPARQRQSAGKPEQGNISINAFSEGSRVRIRIKDDGHGIDPEVVARVAIERGLLQPGTVLSRNESLRLIFRPGFSTASAVSSVSGRGVGLDAVENSVEQLGGELRVASEPGNGSVFEIALPTTLAVVPSLIVNSGGHKYAISVGSIVEAGYVTADDLERCHEGPFIEWRDLRLPVVRLRELLGQGAELDLIEPPRRYHIVISRSVEAEALGDQLNVEAGAAVIVDSWQGHDEVLVRALGRYGSRWRGVNGAATLADGSTALVIDLPRLIKLKGQERKQA